MNLLHVQRDRDPSQADLIEVGSNKQLFINQYAIEESHAVTQCLHQPAKYVGNPVMIPLYPWEGGVTLFGTVWRDPDDRWRMWYQGYGRMGIPPMGKDISASPWKGFDATNLLYVIGYATSNNGIHWERANLGLIDYEGSKDNNLVLANAAFANVIEDHRDPDPDRHYKSLFFEARDPSGTPNMGDGVSIAFSPDGVRWTKYKGNPVIVRSSDTHMLLGWDDLHDKYVSYCRPSVHEGNKTRRIGRSVSDDFVHWSQINDVLVPDGEDLPGTEFYGMSAFKYEGLYIGQLLTYQALPEEPQVRFAGNINVQLATSRDGIAWERVGEREPFIPNGPPGSIDAGVIYISRAPVIVNEELWFYYSGYADEHGVRGNRGNICLAKLRLDGFVSVDAGHETGTLITKSFRCMGGTLTINTSARGGMVAVAVLDQSGTQYEGYSRQDCALFDGDSTNHRMSWREKLSLEELKDRDIHLKFYLRDASLYAFSVGQS